MTTLHAARHRRWRGWRLIAAVAFSALLLHQPCSSDELDDWEAELEEPALRFGGTVKLIGLGFEPVQTPASEGGTEWAGLASLRLALEGSPRPWLGYECHVDLQEQVFSSSLGQVSSATATETVLFRGAGDDIVLQETGSHRLWAEVDYANVRFTWGASDLTVGRQAVTFGRSFFWNPTDWLSTFAPTEIDREYKGGVDAVRYSRGLGRLGGMDLLFAYGDDGSWDDSAVIGRAFTNLGGWDLEVLGGSVLDDTRVGAAFATDLGGAGLRGEVSWHHPRHGRESDFVRATLEADYQWPNSLHLLVELHHNGFGSSEPADYAGLLASERLTTAQVTNVGRRYLGTQLTYDFTPLLVGSGAVLVNLDDGSGLAYPSLSLSLGDESSLEVGAMLPWGERPAGTRLRSEYGSYFKALWIHLRHTF